MKQVLAKRVYRAIHYADTNSSSSDDNASGSAESENITYSTEWKAVTTEDIPPIRANDVKNNFIYNKNPISGHRMSFERQLKKAKKLTNEKYI